MFNDAYSNPMGWDAHEKETTPDDALFIKAQREAYDMCVLIKHTFGTEQGQKVLKWLEANTILAPSWRSGLDYNQAIAHGFAREGQNALVHDILNKMRMAENYPTFERFKQQIKAGVK